MAEIIADLTHRIIDAAGEEFYVRVAGEPRPDGIWEGWLEYVPLGESEVLLTPIETTQPNRVALEHWAGALTDTFVEGAFARAVRASTDPVARLTAIRDPWNPWVTPGVGAPDPFELLPSDREAMRATFGALTRPMLLSVIAEYGLNPAGKSLAWLSDRQLVTFIIIATEARALTGRLTGVLTSAIRREAEAEATRLFNHPHGLRAQR